VAIRSRARTLPNNWFQLLPMVIDSLPTCVTSAPADAFRTPTQLPLASAIAAVDGDQAGRGTGLLKGPDVEACKQRWTESIEDKYTVRTAAHSVDHTHRWGALESCGTLTDCRACVIADTLLIQTTSFGPKS
jgi:hypothetical protein